MERFWKTVRMPKAVPERREDSVSCTAKGTEGHMTAAMMLWGGGDGVVLVGCECLFVFVCGGGGVLDVVWWHGGVYR